jgi:hypothetical protein
LVKVVAMLLSATVADAIGLPEAASVILPLSC